MKVQRPYFVKGLHEVPTHATERGIVEEPVRRDVGDHALAVLFHVVFGEADELHVVVVEPLRVTFLQPFLSAWFDLVVLHEPHDPLALVLALARIRRIANHDHDGGVAFHLVCALLLGGEGGGEETAGQLLVPVRERVGEDDAEAGGGSNGRDARCPSYRLP